MLDSETRRAILALRARGHGIREIARALSVSRNSVRAVVASGEAAVPKMERRELGAEHLNRIRTLHELCQRNFPAPEMEAFAERFGFLFVAHEVGDVNRSARVERYLSAKSVGQRNRFAVDSSPA